MSELTSVSLQLGAWSALAVAAFWLLGIYSKWWNDRGRKVGLLNLKRELGTLRWMGSDDGWDSAIYAVQKRIDELVRDGYSRLKKGASDET